MIGQADRRTLAGALHSEMWPQKMAMFCSDKLEVRIKVEHANDSLPVEAGIRNQVGCLEQIYVAATKVWMRQVTRAPNAVLVLLDVFPGFADHPFGSVRGDGRR